jgi:hypothetical protein
MTVGAEEQLDWDLKDAAFLWRAACSPNHSGLAKPSRPVICYSWASACDRQVLEMLASAEILFIYFMEEQLAGLTEDEIVVAKLSAERLIWRRLLKEGCVAELGEGTFVVKVVEGKDGALEAARSGQAILSSQDVSSEELWEETEHLDYAVDHGLYLGGADDISLAVRRWIGT